MLTTSPKNQTWRLPLQMATFCLDQYKQRNHTMHMGWEAVAVRETAGGGKAAGTGTGEAECVTGATGEQGDVERVKAAAGRATAAIAAPAGEEELLEKSEVALGEKGKATATVQRPPLDDRERKPQENVAHGATAHTGAGRVRAAAAPDRSHVGDTRVSHDDTTGAGAGGWDATQHKRGFLVDPSGLTAVPALTR